MSGNLGDHGDVEFQIREWKIQRIAWAVMALFLLAALFGTFGSGPLNNSTKTDPGGRLSVEYERFGRLQTLSTLRFRIGLVPRTPNKEGFWIASSCLENVEVSEVTPKPEKVEVEGTRLIYSYASRSDTPQLLVMFYYKPVRMGWLRCRVGLLDGTEIQFNEFVYP